MDNLEKLVRELDSTDLSVDKIDNIFELKNDDGQNALMLACKLGLCNAISKMSKSINTTEIKYRKKKLYMSANSNVNYTPIEYERYFKTIKKSFDLFEKDNDNKDAVFYALNNNYDVHASLFLNFDDSRLDYLFSGSNTLSYYMFIYEKLNEEEKMNYLNDIRSILNKFSNDKKLISELSSDDFNNYISFLVNNPNELSTFDEKFFEKLCENISRDVLNKGFNATKINKVNKYDLNGNMLNKSLDLQKILLKNGSDIQWDVINYSRKKISDSNLYSDSYKALIDKFNDQYTIDIDDVSSIIGKSKQVIEDKFSANYVDVINYFFSKDNIDYQTTLKAINCPYDDSRLLLLQNLGVDFSDLSIDDDNLFGKMSPNQVIQVLCNGQNTFRDSDIIAINKKSYSNIDYDNYREKLYNLLNNYEPKNKDNFYRKVANNNTAYMEMYNFNPIRFNRIELILNDIDNKKNNELNSMFDYNVDNLSETNKNIKI